MSSDECSAYEHHGRQQHAFLARPRRNPVDAGAEAEDDDDNDDNSLSVAQLEAALMPEALEMFRVITDLFRAFQKLGAARPLGQGQCRVVAIDGKVLRGSFDAFHDGDARQFLSASAAETALTIAHIQIDEKSNEIPAAQQLLAELDLAGRIVTLDAIHCQKNICDRQGKGRGPDRPAQGEPGIPAQAG